MEICPKGSLSLLPLRVGRWFSEFLPGEGCSVQGWPEWLLSSGQEALNNVVLEGSPTVLCFCVIVSLFLPLAPKSL